MRDPITDAAQDPSCLLCLTPDRGGSWWSRLCPAMPRDFSEGYRWDALQAAMYSSLPWTSDYHFTFDFTVADDFENGSYWIMYQSNGRISFALDKDARGCRFVFGSYSFNGGVFVYAPFASSLAGRHEVTLAVEGATLRVTVDGTVYEQSGERVESSAYNRVVTTSAPVTLHAVSLTDDSTGTAVWQAAYSDLYDTSNPWPSPVPRNFAEEPEAWRGLMAVIAAATETDWSFKIRYNLNSADGSQRIFSPGNNTGPIAVFWSSEGILYLRTIGGNGTIIQANPAGDPTGTHTVEIIAASGLYSIIYDGKTVHSVQDTPTLPRSSAEEVIQSGMNGTILYAEFSCGKAVWRYPSEAERVRLITKTNVRTDRGAFEAADETQPARVDTALDLRGKVSSYTVVVDFEAAEFPETTTMECHQELAGQGGALIGSSYPPICSIGYYLTSSGSARLQLSQEVAGGRHVVNATLTGRLSGRHICCGVVEVDPASPLTASTLYLDGVRIGNASIYAVPTGNAAVNATCFSIAGDSFTGGWPPYTGKVYSGLLFDRALSAAEIAALTPKQA